MAMEAGAFCPIGVATCLDKRAKLIEESHGILPHFAKPHD